MRPSLQRNALLAAALAAAGALGVAGTAYLRGAPATNGNGTIATEPPVSLHVDQTVSKAAPSLSSLPAPPGAPPPLAGPPPIPPAPADPDADPDSDSPDSDNPVHPPEPISLEEYLQHGSKEPLVPPVIHVDAKPAPGSVPTEEPLVPPVISVTATPIDAPADSAAAAAPLVPPVVNVASPAAPR